MSMDAATYCNKVLAQAALIHFFFFLSFGYLGNSKELTILLLELLRDGKKQRKEEIKEGRKKERKKVLK